MHLLDDICVGAIAQIDVGVHDKKIDGTIGVVDVIDVEKNTKMILKTTSLFLQSNLKKITMQTKQDGAVICAMVGYHTIWSDGLSHHAILYTIIGVINAIDAENGIGLALRRNSNLPRMAESDGMLTKQDGSAICAMSGSHITWLFCPADEDERTMHWRCCRCYRSSAVYYPQDLNVSEFEFTEQPKQEYMTGRESCLRKMLYRLANFVSEENYTVSYYRLASKSRHDDIKFY